METIAFLLIELHTQAHISKQTIQQIMMVLVVTRVVQHLIGMLHLIKHKVVHVVVLKELSILLLTTQVVVLLQHLSLLTVVQMDTLEQ